MFVLDLNEVNGFDCRPDLFKCSDDLCIPRIWLCDLEKDCENGEDEDQHNCKHLYNDFKDNLKQSTNNIQFFYNKKKIK